MFTWLNRFQPLGALAMRLALGAIMVAHGYLKVIPHGALDGFIHMVTHMGLPAWMAYMAAFTEFFGGMLLIVGLFSRIAALLMAIEMTLVIFKVHLHFGIISPKGYALPMACLAIALMLVFSGSGPLALDDLVGRSGGRRAKVR